MPRNINIWYRIDKVTVFLFLLMMIMGWFNIYAAVYNEDHKEILDFSQRYGKQFIWIIAAIILAVIVVIIDTRFYLFFAWGVYAALVILLVLVLFFGKEVNGARSWFQLGPLTIQPSEFAKFATALALAGYLNNHKGELTRLRVILPAAAIIFLPALLTAKQPDMGSTVVFFSFFIVLFREGMSPYIFVSALLMIILFFLTLLMDNLVLELILAALAFLLTWFVTRKSKLSFTGLGITLLIGGSLFALDHFVLGSIGNENILIITLILAGLAFAYYIYQKKAMSILVIYLFLLGSIIYINTVDFAFNNLL